MAYAGDPDVIDPDPEGKRVFLQGNTWLDHCVEADEFLIRALELIESSDACAADASRDAVLSGLERVRAGVTKRPHETLVKVANGGSVAWARQCADADAAIESALDLFERAPASFRDRPAVVAVAEGLHRVRGVVTRVAPRTTARIPGAEAASPPAKVARTERARETDAPFPKLPHLTLKYLDTKGLAEPARLALTVGRIPFEDVRVSYEDVARLRAAGELPFGQVPVLEVRDAEGSAPTPFGQSSAILRFVGRLANLYPSDPGDLRQLRVDAVEELLADARRAFVPLWYRNALPRSPTDGSAPEATALDDARVAAATRLVNDTYLPARAAQVERLLESTAGLPGGEAARDAGPYVCGDEVTVADLSLYVFFEGVTDAGGGYCPGVDATDAVERCPRLKRLLDAVANRPDVEAWNASVRERRETAKKAATTSG